MNQQVSRIGIWLRVSTEDQVKGDSLEHHEERARRHAELRGWDVVQVYTLDGVSGKKVLQHPEAQRMLRDIEQGRIDALVFSKLARLARNTKELLELSQAFQDAGVAMVSLQEQIDTSSPSGRFFFTMLGAMAEWEREEIVDRIKASVKVRAELGKFLGGQAPFGYSVEDQALVLNEKEAPIRKLMFELFLEHKRKKTVARILNERGYRTRKGAGFSDATITRLLEDPIAKGLRRINYTRSLGEGKKWVLKPEEEWKYVKVPAIVSEELWDKVNAILKDRKSSRVRVSKVTKHLFTNFLFCTCGQKMFLRTQTNKYSCSKCREKILKDDIEKIFHELLKNYSFSEEALNNELEHSQEEFNKLKTLIENLQKEKKEIQIKIKSLLDLHAQGQIPTETFNQHFNEPNKRLSSIEIEISRLEGELSVYAIDRDSKETLIKEAQDLYTRFPSFSHEEKRKVVELVTNKITFGNGGVDVDLAFIHPSEKSRQNGNTSMPMRLF